MLALLVRLVKTLFKLAFGSFKEDFSKGRRGLRTCLKALRDLIEETAHATCSGAHFLLLSQVFDDNGVIFHA